MERIPLHRRAITQSEINGNCQIQFTTSENVFQESVSLLNQHFIERELRIFLFGHEEFHFAILWIFKLVNGEQTLA